VLESSAANLTPFACTNEFKGYIINKVQLEFEFRFSKSCLSLKGCLQGARDTRYDKKYI